MSNKNHLRNTSMIEQDKIYEGRHGYWYRLGIDSSGNWQVYGAMGQTRPEVVDGFSVCSKLPHARQEAVNFMLDLLIDQPQGEQV